MSGTPSWTNTVITDLAVSDIENTAVIGRCVIISEFKGYVFYFS